ncbi:hypothetical protein VNI00_014858 [Paramarasmius palmivorus]|uniref:Peptidase A1 domain-containing protein n=1 Tax=Paramarasmius palmivorus TaxID=297713 RepID=A0AAW0BS04_9AGAR
MHSFIPLSLLLITLDFSLHALAVKIPFRVLPTDYPTTNPRLARRGSSTVPLQNIGNAQYVANITLAGVDLPVLLDTGSSDLWVNFPSSPPTTTDLGKSLSLNYAIGSATGRISAAKLEFGGYSIENQAFLQVDNANSFSTDIHKQGYAGLMGLGPNSGSQIMNKIDSSSADSVLSRIYTQNKTSQNFISFMLDRKGTPSHPVTGQITVSEFVTGWENITSMPKLDVEQVHKLLDSDQHWQALTDKSNGIIGPDGQVINVKTIVPKAPKQQLVAVFDSGFTFSQVPRDVSDAIYGRVQGAVYDSKNEWWTVPCGQMLNISFNFGGKNYPIHPLDTVDDNFNVQDANGNRVCIGAFQPITSAFSLLGNYDMIMGMNFLRNTYTLMDFGNWVEGASTDRNDPYIQLLSVTDVQQAHTDFVSIRLGGTDTSGDSKWSLLPSDQMQHSPVSDEEKKKKYQEMVLSRWPYILMGCLIFVLLVIGCVIWKCCCRRRFQKKNAKGRKEKGESAMFGGTGQPASYLPLQEPNTASSYDLPLKEPPTSASPGYHDGRQSYLNHPDQNRSGFLPSDSRSSFNSYRQQDPPSLSYQGDYAPHSPGYGAPPSPYAPSSGGYGYNTNQQQQYHH